MADPWWRDAVIYQIYPRSFCDTDGDGIGDLDGVRAHLDHLVDLGVDAIWLSPIQPSPDADFGYDVADYCDVDARFGGLEAFDALVAEVHERDMKVICDWVPNHTSDQHPWFLDARSSRTSEHRDFYVWRDGSPDVPPNNWQAAFPAGPAWTWDPTTEAWYLHLFTPNQPDLNWANPEVEAAMHDTLRFWLDRGVDGFRMDVIHAIGKDPDLADVPDELAALPACVLNHRPETHALLRRIRAVVDGYDGDRLALGEVYLLDAADIAAHYGADDELHLCFAFPLLHAPWSAAAWRHHLGVLGAALGDRWPAWVLSNHDAPRHRTRYGSERRARAATMALLALRGTPVLYQGEELGLADATIDAARAVDPGGRDGCRAPIPWSPTPPHGWATDEPWLPWPPGSDVHNAQTQTSDPGSTMGLYRDLLSLRRRHAALRAGSFTLLDTGPEVLAWDRARGDQRVRCVVAFAEGDVAALVADHHVLATSTSDALDNMTLSADATVWLRPN